MTQQMSAEVSFHEFEDVDFFREVLSGWDTEPTQLTSGKLLVQWDQIALDDITISRLRTNLKIADRSAYQANHVGFVVCLGSKTFCGRPVHAGSLVLFGPGREYRNLLLENWESFEISMTSRLFQSLSFVADATRRIALGPEYSVLHLSPQLVAAFRAFATNFLAPFHSQPNLVGEPDWVGAIRERSLALLAQAFFESGCAPVETRLNHTHGWALAARALDYIDHNEHERPTVLQMSQAMGCTNRALQSAFQRALGVTPLQYVLARRLHRVRSDLLLRTNGPPVVTRAAANHGFLHFGRFSHHYQRLFGEFPSDTVRRARLLKSSF